VIELSPAEPAPLRRLEDAVQLLAAARSVDEVKNIRDMAEAARVYAREAQLGLEAQNHAAEIKLRAERRAGELLRELPRHEGNRYGRREPLQPAPTLEELGLSRSQSHRYQAVASIPERLFEDHLAETKQRGQEITTSAALRLAADHQRARQPIPMPHDNGLARPSRVQLLQMDVRGGLAQLEPASVQTCVTSVPYWGLRAYGTAPQVWGGDSVHTHTWDAVPYVWSPGGNGERSIATSGLSSSSAAIRQAIKRPHAGTMGSLCGCGAWCGELGSEPTPHLYVEHIVEVFREVWRVLKADGTLWLNIGFSYAGSGKGPTGWSGLSDQVARQGFHGHSPAYEYGRRGELADRPRLVPGGYKPKDLVPIPWLVAMALQAEGWYWRSTIAWCKRAPMPESVDDRPTSAWEPVLLLSKSRDYFYDQDAVAESTADSNTHARTGSGPVSLDGKQGDRGDGVKANPSFHQSVSELVERRNMRNVWLLAPEPFPEAHFAVFPTEVPRRCILAGSRPGDLVLDPFAGAGTTNMVAARLGRDSVGIELKPEYVAMAADRIRRDGGFTVEVTQSAEVA
jgi:DNA modification methylase